MKPPTTTGNEVSEILSTPSDTSTLHVRTSFADTFSDERTREVPEPISSELHTKWW